MSKYECLICKKSSSQKGHHETHLASSDHKQKCEIFKLKLETKTHDELICEYPVFKNNTVILEGIPPIEGEENIVNQNKIDIIERIIQSMTTGKMEMNAVSNKHQLREWIHDTHNFLRNSGAGYGMKPLNLFILFYGLMRLEEYNMLAHEEFKELNDEK